VAEVEWWDHEEADAMASELAGDIGFIIDQAIAGHGRALIALPGTPAAVPGLLALAREELAWAKVQLIPSFEGPEGRESGALEALFGPLGAEIVPLAEAGQLGFPCDLVWLTSGTRGEVAGIAAGAGMAAALTAPRPVIATEDGGHSLSGAAILAARALVLTLYGPEERDVAEAAIADGAGSRWPLGRLLAEASQAIDIHCLDSEGGDDAGDDD
jgi:6-phosphogluconolactonase